MEQEVVNETPAEQTVETESTPVEEATTAGDSVKDTETSEEAPVSETTDSDKVSKSVPYDRFKEVNEEVKALKEQVASMQPSAQPQPSNEEPVVEFDQETTNAVKRLAAQQASEIMAQQRVAEYQAKHAAELEKDPLLKVAVEAEMRSQAAKGEMINPEKAHESAQKILDDRIAKQTQAAKQEGVTEGQDIAKTKQQLGAIGETGKIVDVGDDSLSSAELAKKYNLPISN